MALALWSLLCEEIYYAAYPALRWLRNRFGWRMVLAIAFPTSVGVAATHVHSLTWHTFGPVGTAVILLPVWLLGCVLAEQSEALAAESSRTQIWGWRMVAWLGCWISEILHFKGHMPYTQTMLWFGVLSYWWVRKELPMEKHDSQIVISLRPVRGVIPCIWCTTKERCSSRGCRFQTGGIYRRG